MCFILPALHVKFLWGKTKRTLKAWFLLPRLHKPLQIQNCGKCCWEKPRNAQSFTILVFPISLNQTKFARASRFFLNTYLVTCTPLGKRIFPFLCELPQQKLSSKLSSERSAGYLHSLGNVFSASLQHLFPKSCGKSQLFMREQSGEAALEAHRRRAHPGKSFERALWEFWKSSPEFHTCGDGNGHRAPALTLLQFYTRCKPLGWGQNTDSAGWELNTEPQGETGLSFLNFPSVTLSTHKWDGHRLNTGPGGKARKKKMLWLT